MNNWQKDKSEDNKQIKLINSVRNLFIINFLSSKIIKYNSKKTK